MTSTFGFATKDVPPLPENGHVHGNGDGDGEGGMMSDWERYRVRTLMLAGRAGGRNARREEEEEGEGRFD